MKNLTNYESFLQKELQESNEYSGMSCPISESAKAELKRICNEVLCKEAEEYHNDENPEHTYDAYVKECSNYINEAMGQSGYSTVAKPNAE